MRQEFHSDLELLLALSRSDNSAALFIYRQYSPIITKWIISNGGDENQAQDIFQDSLVVLYQKSRDAEFCLSASIGTYLFAIAKRLWYKKFKSKYYNHEYQTDFNETQFNISETLGKTDKDINDFLEKEQNFEILNQAMNELGSPCSEVLNLFYVKKMSMADIADHMKYANVETAKVQKYKCLTRLKKIYLKLNHSSSNDE